MAPASKTSKIIKMSELEDIDAFCFICRGVLIKPVTLPCKHVFCYECFQESMTETSYSCPLCRRRLSNWVRSARKCNNLLNTQLWDVIQIQFKNEVASKLSGADDGLDERLQEKFKNQPILSPDGEIGSEYLRQIQVYEEELRRHREEEEKASMEFIERIQEEDKKEKKRKSDEARERLKEVHDRMEAKKETAKKKSFKKSPSTSKSTPKVSCGPMDKHIQRVLNQHSSENFNDPMKSDRSDSGDSITFELNHFKPIRIVPKTPPKAGSTINGPLKKITPVKLFSSESIGVSVNLVRMPSFHSKFSAFKGAIASPQKDDLCETPTKKSKLIITEPMDTGILKEIKLEENSDSNSRSGFDSKLTDDIRIPVSCFGEENLSQLCEEHRRLERRLEQERADHELALQLTRDWAKASELPAHRTQLPRTCRSSSTRQSTLLDTVIRTRRK